MGIFDAFKKKACCICGDEVGIIGNRRLADGNMCSKCARKLSVWFEDRKESTVAQIQEQLAYRERNAAELERFTVSRAIGEGYKMYIEEVNGVPTRFFVTDRSDYKAANPDIISFRDVISCVTDINVRDEEIKQRDSEGKMVSYRPPRFKHHHDFYIKMEIRNNPYFQDIRFRVNGATVTLETVGGVGGGIGGAALSGLMKGVGISPAGMQTNTVKNSSERRRYEECRIQCEKICQAVEDGKRGSSPAQAAPAADPIQALIDQIRNAPDLQTGHRLCGGLAMMVANTPREAEVREQMALALGELQTRLSAQAIQSQAPAPSQRPSGPKFCPNCGAPTEGSKFCQHCGSKLV